MLSHLRNQPEMRRLDIRTRKSSFWLTSRPTKFLRFFLLKEKAVRRFDFRILVLERFDIVT